MNTAPTAKPTLSARKAVAILGSTLAFTIVALALTAGSAAAGHEATQIPERNILVVDSGSGATFETDLPLGQAEHLVRVSDQYLHINLATSEVKEDGWELTKMPIDPESPIQAYDLTPVK